jgi:glyoxylase-like metal-dependent hydrolase (beta-lactamase superfamily II)
MRLALLASALLLAGCGGTEQSAETDEEFVAERVGEGEAVEVTSGPVAPGAIARVHVLDCGLIEVGDLDVFADDGSYAGQTDEFVDTCFLAVHADGRSLLWDLGVPAMLAGAEPMAQPPFTVSLDRTLEDQLAEIGASPDFVAISHSHFDHVGQAEAAEGATWLVHEAELEHMKVTLAEDPTGGFETLMGMRTEVFEGRRDVFGDESAVIVPTPGHTPGHSSLLLTLQGTDGMPGERVLLTGDLYHRAQSREEGKVPRFDTDAEETRASMAAFERLAEETGARVLIQHEDADVGEMIGGTIR